MRLETLVAMDNLVIPSEFIRRYISSAIDIIIHTARLADGKRKILSFQEITGMEGNVMTLQEIFSYRKEGIDQEGKVEGNFEFHGVRPNFMEKLKIAGIQLPQMSK